MCPGRRVLLTLLTAGALAAGCGDGGEPDTPERTVETFIDALGDGDGDRACAELTEDGKREFTAVMPVFVDPSKQNVPCEQAVELVAGRVRDRDVEITAASVRGDRATVVTEGGPQRIDLRRDDDWRIDAQFKRGWPAFGIPAYPPRVPDRGK